MKIDTKKYSINALVISAIVLLSIFFVSCFSKTTSPFFLTAGADSSIFKFIGSSILQGKQLYVDVFDHKGPILFLIQYLGQLIHPGRFGIFLLQIVFMTGSLFLIYKTSRLLLSRVSSFFVIILFLFILRFFYERGNLSEEFSLVFAFYVIYIIFKKLIHKKNKISSTHLFLMGASLSSVALIRINNAAPILAALLTYFIYLLVKENLKTIIRQSLIFFAGFASVIILVLLYFILNNSLSEMIYATFLFNFNYSSFNIAKIPNLLRSGYIWWGLLSLGLCISGGIFYRSKSKEKWILLFSIILGFACFLAVFTSTTGYFHYLQMTLPALVIGLILVLRPIDLKSHQLGLCVLGFLPLIMLLYGGLMPIKQYDPASDIAYRQTGQSMIRHIPMEDRDKVFGWNIPSVFWIESKIIPNHKFYTFQGWWGKYDTKVYQSLEEHFKNTPPKWVIIISYEDVGNAFIKKFLMDNYSIVDQQGYILLKLN